MFWTLDYDSGAQKRTGEPDGTFLKLTTEIMPKANMVDVTNRVDVKDMKDRVEKKPEHPNPTIVASNVKSSSDIKSTKETTADKKSAADPKPNASEKDRVREAEKLKPENRRTEESAIATAMYHQYRPRVDKSSEGKESAERKKQSDKSKGADLKEKDEIDRLDIGDLAPEYQKRILGIRRTQNREYCTFKSAIRCRNSHSEPNN